MTGFGRAQATLDGIDLSVEISSVNRRNLEVSVSLPREWQSIERDIQAAAKTSIHRGKLYIQLVATAASEEGGFFWDQAGFEASLARLEQTAAAHGIEWQPSSDAIIRLAALHKVESCLPDPEVIHEAVIKVVKEAAVRLVAMRSAEGESLIVDLRQRLGKLVDLLDSIEKHTDGTVDRYRDLLMQRLSQAGLELDLSDERVLKEVAIFADRCDITEEITRLRSHLEQFSETTSGKSPIGRKLEFLLQEVNREFNTIGSKANNIEISRLVIEAKNEIERIREQIQNIE